MEISPVLQARLLLWCASLGAVMGVLWELRGALLALVKVGRLLRTVLTFFCDLLFVCFSGVGIIILSYYFNKGEVRLFSFLGFFAAFFVARVTLGKIFSKVIIILLRILYKIVRLILSPFVKTFKYLVNILQNVIYFILKGIAKISILVYNICIAKLIPEKLRLKLSGGCKNNGRDNGAR